VGVTVGKLFWVKLKTMLPGEVEEVVANVSRGVLAVEEVTEYDKVVPRGDVSAIEKTLPAFDAGKAIVSALGLVLTMFGCT
jgi:hypothetical protein